MVEGGEELTLDPSSGDDNDPMLCSSLSKICDDMEMAHFATFLNDGDANWTHSQKWLSTRRSFSKKKATIVKCEYCGVILKHPSKIEAHRRTHTGEKPFECQICGSRFSQRTPMRMHVRRHMGLTPYACSCCGKRFVSNALKNAHELKAHMGAKRRGPPRPHLKPPRRSVPMKHSEHNDEHSNCQLPANVVERRKIDEIVDDAVTSNSLPSERKIKTRRKKALIAQCQQCGLLLKHPSKIQAHMRTHTGERPFECGLCGMRFTTANPLRVHFRRVHTGEKPYECTWECGRRFVSVSARNEHERIVHAGIKRYHCSINNCHRMFTRRCYLIVHQAKEHKDVTEQADNAIQCVLNMVKQEREETRTNVTWSSEVSNGCVEKVWLESEVANGEQIEKQRYLENGDAVLECSCGADEVEDASGLLNDEGCRQVVIDRTDEDAMEESCFAGPSQEYYHDQNDDIRLEDSEQQHSDGHQFMGGTGSSNIGHSITTETGNMDIYTVCEESTTFLPKYGRIRIIRPMTKKL